MDNDANTLDELCSICEVLGPLEEKDTCYNCLGNKTIIEDCYFCNASGEQVCPTCRGTGFEVVNTQFYSSYINCRECWGKGRIECLSCDGDGKEEHTCKICLGEGEVAPQRICTHRFQKKLIIQPLDTEDE